MQIESDVHHEITFHHHIVLQRASLPEIQPQVDGIVVAEYREARSERDACGIDLVPVQAHVRPFMVNSGPVCDPFRIISDVVPVRREFKTISEIV